MIGDILRALRTAPQDTQRIKEAKGLYSYPETLNELKNALNFILKNRNEYN